LINGTCVSTGPITDNNPNLGGVGLALPETAIFWGAGAYALTVQGLFLDGGNIAYTNNISVTVQTQGTPVTPLDPCAPPATTPTSTTIPTITPRASVTATPTPSSTPTNTPTVTATPTLTPVAKIQVTINQINELVAGSVLNNGQGRALIQVLEAAAQQLDRANVVGACMQLSAFTNQTKAFVAGGLLSSFQGQVLLNSISGVC
jgi:hypothetical protein